MNERIEELIKDCTEYVTESVETYFDKDKFAELIVKQCIAIAHADEEDLAKRKQSKEAMAAGMVAYKISRYFGVKE